MTNDQIRIAVAEECGWTDCVPYRNPSTMMSGQIAGTKDGKFNFIPNYPKSLDACAEFEKALSVAHRIVYAETLCAILKGEVVNWGYYPGEAEIDWDSISALITATPLQRCEAFLRLKGKWVE